jgi:hypothetical protein
VLDHFPAYCWRFCGLTYEVIFSDIQTEGLLCSAELQEEPGADHGPNLPDQDGDLLFGSTVVQCVRLTYLGQEILGFVFAVRIVFIYSY